MKPETWLETLNCAIEGVLHAVHTQRHMRWHIFSCLALLTLTPFIGVTGNEFALLSLAAAMVIVAELANTALETAVDLISPEFHRLAKEAKDAAAGAVLVAAAAAVVVGWVIFYPKLQALIEKKPMTNQKPETILIAAIFLIVLSSVVLLKALVGKGKPLHGGFPSGHAAVSFAVATLISLRTRDLAASMLSFLLAAMVSHSRLLNRIHSKTEVIAGAVLGFSLAFTLYFCLR